MPTIRFRPNNACSAVVGDIPGGTAFLRTKPRAGQPLAAAPVQWLGFICKTGARRLPFAQTGKLVAMSITNGDFLSHDWRHLTKDEYVVGMLVQVDDQRLGAFGVVDRDGWPLVRSETKPKLTIVTNATLVKVATFKRR